ncbi:MAG: nuclear transport factor 2 family protein [Terrimicrobiaceae bacterium]
MKTILLILLPALLLGGCSTTKPTTIPSYLTAGREIRGVILSPQDSKTAIGRFEDYFSDITEKSVLEKTKNTYAPAAFFNDTLKTIRGSREIEKYFLRLAANTDFTRVRLKDVARSGASYYVRWEMDFQIKGSTKTITTIGMSELRFDSGGLIVLHQDFWDSTAGIFEHLPVLGTAILWIKKQL